MAIRPDSRARPGPIARPCLGCAQARAYLPALLRARLADLERRQLEARTASANSALQGSA